MEKIFVVLKLSKGGMYVCETDTLFDRYLYMQLAMLLGMTNVIIFSAALYSFREDPIKPKRN